jgi:hypothetical protein
MNRGSPQANRPKARREMRPTAATPVLGQFPLRVTLKKVEFLVSNSAEAEPITPADLGTPLELVMSQIAAPAPEWLVRLSDFNTSLMN